MTGTVFIFLAVIFSFTAAFANEQEKLLSEFSAGLPYYQIKTSKDDHKYFVLPVGPCACNVGPPFVMCSTDVQKDLEAQLTLKTSGPPVVCPPNAGCSPGHEIIYADCPKRKVKKPKKL